MDKFEDQHVKHLNHHHDPIFTMIMPFSLQNNDYDNLNQTMMIMIISNHDDNDNLTA